MLQLFQASITVHLDGYHWVVQRLHRRSPPSWKPQMMLVNRGKEVRTYDPFRKEPQLFRIFSELEESSGSSISGFADLYGGALSHVQAHVGYSLPEWQKRIAWFRGVVRLVDAMQADDGAAISTALKAIEDDTTETFLNYRSFAKTVIERARETADWLIGCGHGGIALALQRAGGVLLIRFHVLTMIDAMRVQLAMHAASAMPFRRCEECGHPFVLSPELNRSDRVFCKNSCRLRAYRRRRSRAVEMRAAGKTVRQIAAELGSDAKTVKSWLSEDKGNGTKKAR